jgi:hypothetical protein
MDVERVNQLAQEITDMTTNADTDPDTIFEALQQVFIFWMSIVCANCRRNVARKLTADIPKMIDCADQTAAVGGSGKSTCH